MRLFYVNYTETYDGDYHGTCEEGQWGPWDNREAAEQALAVCKTRKRGKAFNFKPLYDHLEITEGEVVSEFKESQVW